MIVAGLLALAMVASLLLVVSDSVQILRIAVVVALWAATVGAIAMTKYRRESALEKAKVDDLKTVYDLQLEREISARREYELTVEEKVRSDLRIDAEEMAALRHELATLRRNLEVLFDGRLPDDNVALGGQADRRRELDATTRVTAPRPSGPAFASPDDEPLTAETITVGSPEEPAERAPPGCRHRPPSRARSLPRCAHPSGRAPDRPTRPPPRGGCPFRGSERRGNSRRTLVRALICATRRATVPAGHSRVRRRSLLSVVAGAERSALLSGERPVPAERDWNE